MIIRSVMQIRLYFDVFDFKLHSFIDCNYRFNGLVSSPTLIAHFSNLASIAQPDPQYWRLILNWSTNQPPRAPTQDQILRH